MSPVSQNDKNLELFRRYIFDKKIVIVDTNTSSRVGIARMLSNLGAKGANIRMAGSYNQGVKDIEEIKPHIVVCDFDLEGMSGLELIQSLKKQSPDFSKSLFIIVTGNSSQTSVSQAAEEDVDTYILKPYTIEIFRQSVLKAAVTKIYPNDYIKKVDEGKKLLLEQKPAEAKKIFEEAKAMDPKPSLACYYIGQAELMVKAYDQAQNAYNDGLEFNKIHYKCLTGLFELLMERNMHEDAYEAAKRITRYFPPSPQRLLHVLRLAIVTKSYEDVERYYQSFIDIETRSDELVRYICAALVVCGKHYIATNNPSRGLELFRKAAVTGTGKTKILKEIITALVEKEIFKEAREYLSRFPSDQTSGTEYHAMSFLIASSSQPHTMTITQGRELLKKDIHDPLIYDCLIKACIKGGYKDEALDFIQRGIKQYPDQGALFEKLSKEVEAAKGRKSEAS